MLPAIVALTAAPSASASPYAVDWVTDGAVLAGLQTLLWAADIADGAIGPTERCPMTTDGSHCDPKNLTALDRSSVGNNSTAWDAVSDWGRGASFFGAAVGSAFWAFTADSDQRLLDWLRDGMVILLAVSASELSTSLLKLTYARPRPTQYVGSTYERSLDAERSFPSGHTSATAAAATALAATVAYRKPWSMQAAATALAAAAVTCLVAAARVEAGRHFPSDVAAGAALGAGTALLVTAAHRRSDLSVGALPGVAGLTASLAF